MRILIHDNILITEMPATGSRRYIEAAVDFGRLLQTAYKDILQAKYPGAEVDVNIEVKMLGFGAPGLSVDVTGSYEENEPEIIQALLAAIRERTYQEWLGQAGL